MQDLSYIVAWPVSRSWPRGGPADSGYATMLAQFVLVSDTSLPWLHKLSHTWDVPVAFRAVSVLKRYLIAASCGRYIRSYL